MGMASGRYASRPCDGPPEGRIEKLHNNMLTIRQIINNESNGRFDGIIACVGTCGDPKMPKMPGQENFKGQIVHSSKLDGVEAHGKKVLVIGGGASAVEALEFVAHEEAEKTYILARSEKWIIPRNPVVDVLLSLNIFGSETIFSWIPENLLRLFFYRDLADLSPPKNSGKGLFTETPMVNSDVLELVRSGHASWLRGDITKFSSNGKGSVSCIQDINSRYVRTTLTYPSQYRFQSSSFWRTEGRSRQRGAH